MFHFICLLNLSYVSGYFNALMQFDNVKEGGEVSVSFPDGVSKNTCLFFLKVISTDGPLIPTLMAHMSMKDIFFLADYFAVDSIFQQLSYASCGHLQLGTRYLDLLMQHFHISHPMTQFHLHSIGYSFSQSPDKMLDILGYPDYASFPKLRRHLRSYLRVITYHKRRTMHATCIMCIQPLTYVAYPDHVVCYAERAPCCGSPIHEACVPSYKIIYSCPRCTTSIWDGAHDRLFETSVTTRRKWNIQEKR